MTTTIQGTLDKFPEFISLLRRRKETGALTLTDGAAQVHLYFEHGLLVHAVDGVDSGDQAAYQVLNWKEGNFAFTDGTFDAPRTIDVAQALLFFETLMAVRGNQHPETPQRPLLPARLVTPGADNTTWSIALPEGQVQYDRLKASFVNLRSLFDELTKLNFSGYMTMLSKEREGLVILYRGVIFAAYVYQNNAPLAGLPALDELITWSQDKDAEIGVFCLSDKTVASLTALIDGRIVHAKLDTQFIKMDALLKSLADQQFTGAINIRLPDDAEEGLMLLDEGQEIGSYYRYGRELLSDDERPYQIVAEPKATIWVFATQPIGEGFKIAPLPPSVSPKNLALLADATRRCLMALSALAGTRKALEYLEIARRSAVHQYPWLASLKMSEDETVRIDLIDLKQLTLAEAVAGFTTLLDGCREQGHLIFGEKVVKAQIQKQMITLRGELAALGLPENWY